MAFLQLADPIWLYYAALIVNGVTLGYIFISAGTSQKVLEKLARQLEERISPLLRALSKRDETPASPSRPEGENLREIAHFSRNPRAFNFSLPDTPLPNEQRALLTEVDRRLREQKEQSGPHQATSRAMATSPEATDNAAPHAENLKKEFASFTSKATSNRFLGFLVMLDLIIFVLMAISHFQYH